MGRRRMKAGKKNDWSAGQPSQGGDILLYYCFFWFTVVA